MILSLPTVIAGNMAFDLKEHPHRRFNPLTREWILVSPHRDQRPWLGQMETVAAEAQPAYDPACYMCPRNTRASGTRNPDYKSTFVFDNDYAALLPDTPLDNLDVNGLFLARNESGICRVVCFCPRHDLTIARMSREEIRPVVDLWVEQSRELGSRKFINYVQVFENRGAMMGASNPHPHCQIWASASVPNEPAKEQVAQREYQAMRHSCLLCDYLAIERERGERIVFENQYFTVLVPFWAIWPFEALVLSREHLGSLIQLAGDQKDTLADALKSLTTRYDQLFQVSFPYSMGFHQAPSDGEPHPEWHLHAHFYPPLLRSATVRKFMVGYEMLGTPQRDITAENAAARLREMKETS
jgi:UDPglucose--hexose-1-phosphate uridylyltransferase